MYFGEYYSSLSLFDFYYSFVFWELRAPLIQCPFFPGYNKHWEEAQEVKYGASSNRDNNF